MTSWSIPRGGSGTHQISEVDDEPDERRVEHPSVLSIVTALLPPLASLPRDALDQASGCKGGSELMSDIHRTDGRKGAMKRVVALLTVSLFTVFAAGAGARPAAPPTLSGEAFHDDAPTITSVICFGDQPPFRIGGTFAVHGTATGPYPGTFQETGSAFVSRDANGSLVDELAASFSISSPLGHVTGTQLSTGFGSSCSPSDDPNANIFTFNTADPQGFAATDTYTARISNKSGSFADSGLFQAAMFGSFDERFSSALAAPKPLPPTSEPQCKNRGWRYHPQFRKHDRCVRSSTRGHP
jgi:hypothetical protein